MPIHANLGGAQLHYPLGRSSEGQLELEDDQAFAYQITSGSNNQFNVSTVIDEQSISIGNASTNPKILAPGSGNVGIGTLNPASPNLNAVAVQVTGASVGIVLDSTSGGGTSYEIQNNSETFKIQYDTTNRMTIDNTGKVGFGADPSSPNGNAKVVEIKDTSVGVVLNSTNGGAAPWEMQNNGGDLKMIYDGAGTPKTAIALDAEGAMRLGAEVSTPDDPGSGNGGYVYIKSDGFLYYRSNTKDETELSSPGASSKTVTTEDSTPVSVALESANSVILIDTVTIAAQTDVTISKTPAQYGSGTTLTFKDSTGGETIDGQNTVTINADYGRAELISDGTNWLIISGTGYSLS